MKTTLLTGGTILMLAAKSALGADNGTADTGMHYYRANELSIDVFGSGSIGKYTIDHLSGDRIRHNTRLGAGVGISYFITRNLGIGADAYAEDKTGRFVDSASANLILRLPVGESGFAPYVFGGGGRQFDLAKVWFAQLGAGMEYRFTPQVGVFIDGRWVLPDKTKYYGVARAGLRLAF